MLLLANRVSALAPPPISNSVSSASLYFRSSAKISWQRCSSNIGKSRFLTAFGMTTRERPSRLSRISDSDRDVAEARRSCAVAGPHGLRRLALATVGRAPKRPVAPVADGVARIPELSGDPAVAR